MEKELFLNRGYYALLALLCLALAIGVYEGKRKKGETLYGKICKSHR